jgi:murein DD-endopeptidase MepM/ murein hydrolase activator NlpD
VLACGLGFGAACTSPAPAATGGAYSSTRANITSVACVAGCSGFDSAKSGSLVRLTGTKMSQVSRVVFLGARGAADDVRAPVSRRTDTLAEAIVPAKAVSGPVRTVNGDGLRSHASRAIVTIKVGGSGGPVEARVVGQRVFQGATRPARLDVLTHQALTVTVVLARVTDGAVLEAWQLGTLPAGTVQSVTWNGLVGGIAQPVGRYEFRVTASGTGDVQAASAPAPVATGAFDLVDHKFPVRGRHSFGTGVAAFGAKRDGHVHQGQDVFAKCGTQLVAARGGVVKLNKFQSAAGNYLIIDGGGTDIDYGYMHLQARSPLKKGAIVMTGQEIGRVGDTGDAVGCHLHFEMWSGPGWYTGGAPFDPLPFLKAWDKYS